MNLKKTAAYYDSHWQNFAGVSYPDAKIDKARKFFNPVIDKISDRMEILDVGCGDGVHWFYLRNVLEKDFSYNGIDVSEKTVSYLSKKTASSGDHFRLMDACELRFPDNQFDFVFSYGVLGYTDQPFTAFSEMVRVCKKGGWIGVFSPDIRGVSKILLQLIRGFSRLLNQKGKTIFANLLVPFFGLAPSESQISLKNASWEQVREVILTDIAPPKLEILSYEKIKDWTQKLNIEIIFDDIEQRTILWGRKY